MLHLIPARQTRPDKDVIFALNAEATKRKQAGEAIINATIGSLMNDDGMYETDAGGLQAGVEQALARTKDATGAVENRPLWNMPILFVLLLGLLSAEWLLRRKWDLA